MREGEKMGKVKVDGEWKEKEGGKEERERQTDIRERQRKRFLKRSSRVLVCNRKS